MSADMQQHKHARTTRQSQIHCLIPNS